MVIQSIRVHPSGPDRADTVPNVSRENLTSAIQLDCMQQSRNRMLQHDYRPRFAPSECRPPCQLGRREMDMGGMSEDAAGVRTEGARRCGTR
jgi:hypothetical protein